MRRPIPVRYGVTNTGNLCRRFIIVIFIHIQVFVIDRLDQPVIRWDRGGACRGLLFMFPDQPGMVNWKGTSPPITLLHLL